MRELGIMPGMRVALHVPNTAAMAVTVVACWRIGAVVVPLSRRYTQMQLEAAVESMDCDVLITQEMLERLCSYREYVFEQLCLSALNLDLSQDATLVLTSGSTGRPKGVLHTLAHHVASAKASDEVLPFSKGDVWLVSLPMHHVGGLALITRALLHGGTLLFPQTDWRTALTRETVTHVSLVPTQLRQGLLEPETASALTRLKVVLVGGASCGDDLVAQACARGVPIHITYGASETASQIATTRDMPVGSGRALSHAEIRIGPAGEIQVKARSLCRGYVVPGKIVSVTDEQGWLDTGDLGRLDAQGTLFVTGRRDTQFISGGENIQPEEIEQALLALPEVNQCVVVPIPDARYGQRPVAFVQGTASQEAMNNALGSLEKFKHPDHFFDWPEDQAAHMKPNRSLMQDLAKSLLAL